MPCLYTPTSSILLNSSKQNPFSFHTPTAKKLYNSPITCKASSSSPSSSIMDFDLYDLLGIPSSANQSQIKTAYRSLQKRCHPDIAGGPGHDMAIILNEAYSVLSDPNSRFAYDKELAKTEELKGYTGKPLYSVWLGSESEERACFVDELKCVGCLKCALFAEKTFAIESNYGRARVVAQWADPEHKIQEAIESCPVDCISMVERSNLAALEFLMSKQPRGSVRMTAGNTAGERVSNVFVEVNKFQAKFSSSMDKTSRRDSMDTDLQKEARISAIQAIRAITNWLYWQSPTSETFQALTLTHIARKSIGPNIDKVKEAAIAMKQARENPQTINQNPSTCVHADEYWTPSNPALPNTINQTKTDSSEPALSDRKDTSTYEKREHKVRENRRRKSPLRGQIPIGMAVVGAVMIRLQEGVGGGGLDEHIGGTLALEMVNSSWLHVVLAGVPWYLIGIVLVGLVEAFQSED